MWLPRVTGFDPLAWLSRDKPAPEYSPSSSDAPIDEPLLEEGGAVAPRIEDMPAAELEQIVNFLENRELGAKPKDASTQPLVSVIDEDQSEAESEPPQAQGSLQALEVFLDQYPLNAILIGKGQGSALFGTLRVVEGDQLLDGVVEVRSIDAAGVVLETARDSVRVSMPPPGGGRSLATKQP